MTATTSKKRRIRLLNSLVRIDKDIQYFTEQLKNKIMPLSCVEQLKNLKAHRQRQFKKYLECI